MMRTALLWLHRISVVVGLALMLAEGSAWSWASIRAGHVINLWRFHRQFQHHLFRLIDPTWGSKQPRDYAGLCPEKDRANREEV
jgi:hypothetical protein